MASQGELLVNVTCGSRRLVVANTIPFPNFKHLIQDISGSKNVRMLYVDDEGDHVCLENSDEFLESLRVAQSAGQLQLIVMEGSECEKPKVSYRRGTSTYAQVAQNMAERQRLAKEAAQALLAKLPCEGRKERSVEPEWFESAMRKHTETVVATILARLNATVVREPTTAPAPNVTPDITCAAVVHIIILILFLIIILLYNAV